MPSRRAGESPVEAVERGPRDVPVLVLAYDEGESAACRVGKDRIQVVRTAPPLAGSLVKSRT